jgi:hypothetical protein
MRGRKAIMKQVKWADLKKAIKKIALVLISKHWWSRTQISYPSLHYRYSYDIAHVLELQTIGATAHNGRVYWRRRRLALSALALLTPIAFAAVLASFGACRPPQRLIGAYYGWICYFTFLAVMEVTMALAGVAVFHNLTNSLEKLLTPKGLHFYFRWSNVATAPMPQILCAIGFSAAACVALRISTSAQGMSERLYVAPPSYVAMAVSSAFLSQGMYWIVAGTILSIFLTRPGHMQPSWLVPAYTPGVEMLARCYRLAFYGASIGVSACLFPLLSWVYDGPRSGSVAALKIGLFAISLLVPLLIAVIPQWCLSAVVAQQRRATIEQLNSLLPDDAAHIIPGNPADPDIVAYLDLVSGSPSTTVQGSTVAGILLGLAAAALPYIINFI